MAARKVPLRVAKPGEKATPSRPKTLVEAVEGSERDVLLTMRAKLAAELDGGVPPAYLAPITRQLRDVDKDLRLLERRLADEAGEHGLEGDQSWDADAI